MSGPQIQRLMGGCGERVAVDRNKSGPELPLRTFAPTPAP